MNLDGLRKAVRLRAGVPSGDGIWTDLFVVDAVNDALMAIGAEHPWPWLEVVEEAITGADPIDMTAFTAPVRGIRSVLVDDYYEAMHVRIGDIDQWSRVQGERPRYVFATWADDLLIRPSLTATNTVQVRYYRNEPELTSNTDEPLMPAAYHRAIVHGACALGFGGVDDPSSAGLHQAISDRMVNLMVKTALHKVRGPGSVSVRPGAVF